MTLKYLFAIIFGLSISINYPSYAQNISTELLEAMDEPLHSDIDEFEEFNPDAPKILLQRNQNQTVRYYDFRESRTRTKNIDGATYSGENGLEIYIFDIGQADSMLVVGPKPEAKTLLIDLGKASKNKDFGKRFSARHVGQRILDITGKTHIDYFVLSHFHTDHFGSGNSGLIALMDHSSEEFSIGTMIDTGILARDYVVDFSNSAGILLERIDVWLESGKLESRELPKFGTNQIDLGESVYVDILSFAGIVGKNGKSVHEDYESTKPTYYSDKPSSENDLSIAMKISVGDFEFWTAGDLSGASGNGTSKLSGSGKNYTNVEFGMVKYWKDNDIEMDVEIYRASHHGSRYSSTPQLVEALDPEFVLYSADLGHYHPDPKVVIKMQETARQFATGLDPKRWKDFKDFEALGGTIADEIQILVSEDGSKYAIEGEVHNSYSDEEELNQKDVDEEIR